MTTPATPREIIDAFTGPRSLWTLLPLWPGLSVNTIRLWYRRNRIPGRYWPAIARAAVAAGLPEITIEVIEAAHQRPAGAP